MSGVMVPPVSHNLKRLSGHSLAQIPGPFELPTRSHLSTRHRLPCLDSPPMPRGL